MCKCSEGYNLQNKNTCIANKQEYSPAILLFSFAKEIGTMELPQEKYLSVIKNATLVQQATGVGYDITDKRVYWTDVKRKVIMSSTMDGTIIKTWNTPDIVKPEFLAIDHIGRNIYYSDSNTISISACKIADMIYCKVKKYFNKL